RLQPRGGARPLGMTEIRMCGARGNDQIVVGDFAIRELDDFAIDIDRCRLAEDYVRVLLSSDDGTNRIGDVARIQRRGSDLIQQRLKEMKVAAVDDRHPRFRALERLRGIETAEAAAEDHDVGCWPFIAHRSAFIVFFVNSSPKSVIVFTSPSGPSLNCTCSSKSSSGIEAENVS